MVAERCGNTVSLRKKLRNGMYVTVGIRRVLVMRLEDVLDRHKCRENLRDFRH